MALPNLPRVPQKVFGSVAAPTNNFIQFGSLAAGAVNYTKDLTAIQALAAFDLGWAGAVVGNHSPSLEDMNGLFLLSFSQLAYLLQKGIPEWNADTNYFTGHLCMSGGVIYRSKTENNLGNPVSDTNNWIEYVASVYTPPTPPTPTSFSLCSADQNAVSRNVSLSPGTWQLAFTNYISQNDGGDFEVQAIQTASVDGFVSVGANPHLKRTGGAGFGRHVHGIGHGVANFSVPTQTNTTLSIGAVQWSNGVISYTGCRLTCEKLS